MDRTQALQLLQTALANPNAEFRDGQWEAGQDHEEPLYDGA